MPRAAWGNMASEFPTQQTASHFLPEVGSSTASSIYISWQPPSPLSPASVVEGYRVHYQKVASTYVQYSPFLPSSTTSYSVNNLVADTYYKVCVVMYRNNTVPERECVDAATTSWHIPVSIGSSIGAVLALSIIVLIVLLSRCPTLARPPRPSHSQSSKYDSMSSHFPEDHNDLSDTITQCHDADDDDVFHSHCHSDIVSAAGDGHSKQDLQVCTNNNHHPHPHHHNPHRQSMTLVMAPATGRGGAAGACGHPHLHYHHHHHHHRTMSVGSCGRTQSLSERSRPHVHRGRRARLLQLHSAHNSIQSEPSHLPARPLHVSISDLPPAVRISTPDSPLASPLALPHSAAESISSTAAAAVTPLSAAARVKRHLKDTPRTLHMSIDYDV